MDHARNQQPQNPRENKRPDAGKPHQPPPGKRIDPKDPVEEASHESFPASDAPARPAPKREGPKRPAGENPEKH